MLAHELRNPLAPLSLSLDLLEKSSGDPAMVGRVMTTMRRQLRQMVRLVDDLLDISRISRNRLELRAERIDLTPVLQQSVEAAQPFIETAGLALRADIPESVIPVFADAVRLSQIFGNLLNNAIKYTPRGGLISIAVSTRVDQIEIRVADSGLGIPVDRLTEVFEMFMQLSEHRDRIQGGLGVGLSLVKWLAEMHGGTVEAVSQGLGTGSEFIVRLPLARQAIDTDPVARAMG